MVGKCSSLMLLWCFLLSCSECRLRRFILFFHAKNCFRAGTSLTVTFLSNNCPGERFETFSSILSKGDSRVSSRYAWDCSRMLYYWVISREFRNSTKQPVFTRIHKTGKKAFVLGDNMIFLAFLLRKGTQVLQISFSTQRIVLTWRSRVPKIKTVPLHFTVG